MIRAFMLSVLTALTALAGEWKEIRHVATVDDDGVQRIKVKAGSYYYNPNYIVVKKGIPVELVIVRESAFVPHNIVIEMPGVSIRRDLDPEEETKVRFTPEVTGRFEFYQTRSSSSFPATGRRECGVWLEVVD
ncbi:MAG: cupredoxin domain-containing protein [Aquificota bacterium]|nr:cupredoxin domain-containing protein [Aquificota bacterium]